MMPEVDGLTLLDQICTDYPGLPVVMLTAVHDVHVATNAFRRGAIDYLLKPFELSQLLALSRARSSTGTLLKQNADYRQNLEQIISARTSRLRATMHDLERSYDITLEAMGDALDLRDAETEGHSRRVTAYTSRWRGRWASDADEASHHRARGVSARHRQDRHARLHPAEAGQARCR
jgi:FixJ family two-component response regulator